MESTYPSETLVDFQPITRTNIPEDSTHVYRYARNRFIDSLNPLTDLHFPLKCKMVVQDVSNMWQQEQKTIPFVRLIQSLIITRLLSDKVNSHINLF
jgi:hypothetical protein